MFKNEESNKIKLSILIGILMFIWLAGFLYVSPVYSDYCYVRTSGDVTYPTGWTIYPVVFGTDVNITSGMKVNTSAYKILSNGYYSIDYGLVGLRSGAYISTLITVNDIVVHTYLQETSPNYYSTSGSIILYLNKNDIIKIKIQNGASTTILGTNNYLTISSIDSGGSGEMTNLQFNELIALIIFGVVCISIMCGIRIYFFVKGDAN